MSASTLFTYGPANVDSLLTTTREAFMKVKGMLSDAIFSESTLLNQLERKNKITFQGGASILVPLLYAKNSTFDWFSGDDTLDTSGQEGMTTAQFQWKNLGGTIKYNGPEIRANAGEKRLDLAQAKIKQAQMSARDKLNSSLFASTQASKAISTLPVLADATSTVADINSTTNSWWQAQVTASGVFAARGIDDLRTVRDNIIKAGQQGGTLPDIHITTQTIKELYEASQVAALRYGASDTPDAGKQRLLFAGAAVEFDSNVASGEWYQLPSDSLEYVVNREADWDMSEFMRVPQQNVWIAQLIWMGNLVTSNRRRLGKLTGITA